jgi:ATP-dependent DNA helicase RecQ
MEAAKAILKNVFGYSDFRPSQKTVVKSALEGRDVLAIMPTSGGKSLCFQIPALVNSGVTIVISPLISLMIDQVNTLIQKGVAATYLSSDLSEDESNQRLDGIKQGKYKIVYVSPERFATSFFLSVLLDVDVGLFAIDEAHCTSMWGHDFRPAYQDIGLAITLLEEEKSKRSGRKVLFQKLAFTGTATKEVQTDVIKSLCLSAPLVYKASVDRANITTTVIHSNDKKTLLTNMLTDKKRANQSTVIYAGTRRRVDSTYRRLLMQGFKVSRYHSGLDKKTKETAFNDFMSNHTNIIVCTNSFGMGVDKSDIKNVFHLSPPSTLEDYWQQIGRAGRDGQPANAHLFFNEGKDEKNLLDFVALNYPAKAIIDKFMRLCLAFQEQAGTPELLLTTDDYLLALQPNVSRADIDNILKLLCECGFLSKKNNYDSSNRYAHTYFIDDESLLPDFTKIESRRIVAENKAKGMLSFCKTNSCRRRLILEYLGDMSLSNVKTGCERCDICTNDRHKEDTTDLFKVKLKRFIIELAKAKNIPAFIVLSKQGEQSILEKPPITLTELSTIPGMNPRKTEAFGNEILQFINTNRGLQLV